MAGEAARGVRAQGRSGVHDNGGADHVNAYREEYGFKSIAPVVSETNLFFFSCHLETSASYSFSTGDSTSLKFKTESQISTSLKFRTVHISVFE